VLFRSDYVKPEMAGHLRVNSLFISDNVRKSIQEGRADFTPVLLSEFTLLFKNKVLPLDAALIHVSLPDEHGFCSLGVEVGLTKSPAESAKIIIAEVNEQMPRTLGDSFIHVSRLKHIVLVNYPIPEMPMSSDNVDPVIEHLAGYVADLVPDGATMQMGIGSIPDTILKFLFHKKDLGVHSELISDGVIDLVEAGVLAARRYLAG
jgi:4-hydroxybutyrate CoA-transferase